MFLYLYTILSKLHLGEPILPLEEEKLRSEASQSKIEMEKHRKEKRGKTERNKQGKRKKEPPTGKNELKNAGGSNKKYTKVYLLSFNLGSFSLLFVSSLCANL